MKIGFDLTEYDGSHCETLIELMNSLKYSGHQIYALGINKEKDLLIWASHKLPAPNYYLDYSKEKNLMKELSIGFDVDEDTFYIYFQDVEEEG
jgi:hypothetical protein